MAHKNIPGMEISHSHALDNLNVECGCSYDKAYIIIGGDEPLPAATNLGMHFEKMENN